MPWTNSPLFIFEYNFTARLFAISLNSGFFFFANSASVKSPDPPAACAATSSFFSARGGFFSSSSSSSSSSSLATGRLDLHVQPVPSSLCLQELVWASDDCAVGAFAPGIRRRIAACAFALYSAILACLWRISSKSDWRVCCSARAGRGIWML